MNHRGQRCKRKEVCVGEIVLRTPKTEHNTDSDFVKGKEQGRPIVALKTSLP